MNEAGGRRETIRATLRHLEQYSTLSPFSRMFYRFIYDRLNDPRVQSGKLAQAFHLLLRCECRKHRAVGHVVNQGRFDILRVVQIGRSVHDVLTRLRHALEGMDLSDSYEGALGELILAECSYHLGRTDDVVHALRRGLAMGLDHPLVHFALGYNLYTSAVRRFTRKGHGAGQFVAVDATAFNKTCRDAIAAFQSGLGRQTFDGQIHWWIGLITEALGDRENARRSYRRALSADPDQFGDIVPSKLDALHEDAPPRRGMAERQRLEKLAPISDAEIEAARCDFAQRDIFPEHFLDEDRR